MKFILHPQTPELIFANFHVANGFVANVRVANTAVAKANVANKPVANMESKVSLSLVVYLMYLYSNLHQHIITFYIYIMGMPTTTFW